MSILLYHLMLGVVPFLPERVAVKASLILFGLNITTSDQLNYLSKLFGIYAALFGIFMGLAAVNPLKYKLFIQCGLALFIIRFITMLLLLQDIQDAFGAHPLRIWQCIITIAVVGISLFILMPRDSSRRSL